MVRYLVLGIVLLLGVYLFFCIRRTAKFFGADIKKKRILAICVFAAAALAYVSLNLFYTRAVIILHFVFLSLAMDLLALPVRIFYHKREKGRRIVFCTKIYQSSLIPFALTVLASLYGYYNMNRIIRTDYRIQTDKQIEDCRIVLMTDIHYDTVQNTRVLKEKFTEINELHPDLVVLGGDIVEEGTSEEKMEEAFRMLGGIQSKYGIYYVYGNHDRQPYTNRRTYEDYELEEAIADNGIQILEDAYVEIGEDMILAGRGDAAWGDTKPRASVEEILSGVDRSKYIIMADHQPIHAKENDEQGVDLQISGHTHAGQIWPTGFFSKYISGLNYGKYREGNCNIIVSSGIAGWRYTIRTGEHCEYVVIDIGKR